MKKALLLLFTVFNIFIGYSQTTNNLNSNVLIGKPTKDVPVLWVFIHKTDTLNVYTKDLEKKSNHLPVETIKSIDVLKDDEALKRYPELGKNGVIIIFLKDEITNWKEIKHNLKTDK